MIEKYARVVMTTGDYSMTDNDEAWLLDSYLFSEVGNGMPLRLTKEEGEEMSHATKPVKIRVNQWRFFDIEDDWIFITPWQRDGVSCGTNEV